VEETDEWVGGGHLLRVFERVLRLEAHAFIRGNGKVVGNRKEN